MSVDDIRKNLALFESLDDNLKSTDNIEEAAPMGFFKSLITGAASVFSTAAGEKLNTGTAANKIYADYIKYLTRIGEKANSGRIGDLYTFLANVGDKPAAIVAGISKGTGLPIRTEEDLKKYWETRIIHKDKLGKSILYVVQQMARLPERELDPEAFAKRAQTGSAVANRINSTVQGKTAQTTKTAATVAAPKATPAPAPVNNVEAALTANLKSKPIDKQTASIDAALKALGA